MTEAKQVYKCKVCGIVAEVLQGGAGEMVCCAEPMALQEAKTQDAAKEKHVPYIERTAEGITVRIGQNAAHPMEDKHYIQWIELSFDGRSIRQELKPGDSPQATFNVQAENVVAREFCNLHGLWASS